ncbi:MAG: septum site-determining protein MinC [Gammaproteobacteria bacterium]|jgi:septum site-determining protein MinC|nr:septum site-determining protein MinC [Gammaproteobacteria bacterium]
MMAPRIRANRYSVMTLEWPKDSEPLEQWLKEQCEKAPALMQEIAIVLKPSSEHESDEIQAAVEVLDQLGIGLIGLTGDSRHRAVADDMGLAWLSPNNVTVDPQSNNEQVANPPRETALVVEGPIRSGVQVYAKDRDLVVIGQVSEGAEIMADGHVHVYGRCRGRVAAGVSGQANAEIFCLTFEPELVSLAGTYCGSDQIPENLWSARVRVGLDENSQKLTFGLMG